MTTSSKATVDTSEFELRTLQGRSGNTDSNRVIGLDHKVASVADKLLNYVHGGLLPGKRRFFKDLGDCQSAEGQCGEAMEEFQRLFKRFLAASVGRRCLCLLVESQGELELGPNWASVDLQTVERGAREAGTASIDLEDEYFDVVLCTGLDQVSRPASLVSELRRVLKRGGQIWVQVPLNETHITERNEALTQYWRITPNGLRVLFERFDEIRCSDYPPSGSALRNCSFFYGLKPPSEAEDDVQFEPAALSIFPF